MADQHNFPPLKNDLLLRAARGEPVERVPVWVMRQAGRYMEEFRKVRAEHEFFKLCRTPELASDVTLQPINAFDLDAAIIFSDILVIPQALGMTCVMEPGKGPVFPEPLKDPKDIDKLNKEVNIRESLGYVMDAITLTRKKLDGRVPLIGFAGAPWTLMAYMIEGSGSKTWSNAKMWLYQNELASTQLLQMLTDIIIDYLVEQVHAGAQMLQVFESNAEPLGKKMFEFFALPYLKQIATGVKEKLGEKAVPMTIFAKGAHYALTELAHTDFDVIGLDWTMSIRLARMSTGNQTLMGNLDPCALYASDDEIHNMVRSMLKEFGTSRYIANLGHGIYKDMKPEKVKHFVNCVHRISEEMIKEEKMDDS